MAIRLVVVADEQRVMRGPRLLVESEVKVRVRLVLEAASP